jgi:tetratricopeptide (TPR) repeat protein
MAKVFSLFVLLVLSLSSCSLSRISQKAPIWFQDMEKARAYCANGEMTEAENAVGEANAHAKSEGGCPEPYHDLSSSQATPSTFPGELATLAHCFAAHGHFSEAEHLCTDAITIAESNPTRANLCSPLRALAQINLSQGKNSEATALMERATKLPTASLDDFYALGDSYLAQGNLKSAKEIYSATIKKEEDLSVKSPNLPLHLNKLGRCYFLEHNYDQAEKIYLQALAYTPVGGSERGDTFDGKDLQPLADLYFAKGDLDKADTYYRDSLSGNTFIALPERVALLKNHAKLLRQMNRLDEAKAREEQAKRREKELAQHLPTYTPVIYD